jgi:hypothetical protein
MSYQNTERLGVRKLRRAGWGLSAPVVVGALLLGGCATDADGPAPDPFGGREYALAAFESCDSLDGYLADVATEMVVRSYFYGWGYGGGRGWEEDAVGAPQPGTGNGDFGSPPAAEAPEDFTTTNVQEAGVDEPDQVKTNGETIFYVQNSVLHIIDSWPAEEAIELARVALTGSGDRLFLAGDHLVAFTAIYEGGYWGCYDDYCYDDVPRPMPATDADVDGGAPLTDPLPPASTTEQFFGTRVTVLDVSDPSNPVETHRFDVEGDMVSARLVNGVVYLITMRSAQYEPALYEALAALDLPNVWSLTEAEREALRPEVEAQVRAALLSYLQSGGRASFIPDLRVGDERSDLLGCNDIMRSGRPSDLSMLTVLGFDPTSTAAPNAVGLVAQGWHVYGSQNALYIAQDSRWWWWPTTESAYAETHIHKFELNGGDPIYRASGSVLGWLLNQFSMSEHQGYLRVATTDQTMGGWWWGGPMVGEAGGPDVTEPAPGGAGGTATRESPQTLAPANNVYVLQDNDAGELALVGQVRGLAPNEQIFAVRFLGDRGYIVTFEQVDPLFTLDLSNPVSPRVEGELHITGVSTYLHPFGADHLIGIGREGTPEGRLLGLHLQLFDVSDMTAPTRLHQTLLSTGDGEWSYSQAEHDHHAFTFYAQQNLLAIPVTIESYGWDRPEYNHFSGVIVYRVSVENGFEELGRVSHSELAQSAYCDRTGGYACGWEYGWWAWMQRSAFIEDYLYAFSNVGVTASPIADLSNPVSTIVLE